MVVKVVTDSTADLPLQVAQGLGITVVPLQVHFGNEVYRDGVDLGADEFYQRLTRGPLFPTTSQPSVGAFQETYTSLLQQGKEIVSLHISAKLSGTLNSARLARENLKSLGRIEVVDSLSGSLGMGLSVIAAAAAARTGASLEEVVTVARQAIARTKVLFMVDTLEYLHKGGRIGKAQAFLGSLLQVKPLLSVHEGEIYPVARVRLRRRALERLYEFARNYTRIEALALAYSTTPQDVEDLARRLADLFPREKMQISRFGPVLGTYLGPGAVGIAVRGQ